MSKAHAAAQQRATKTVASELPPRGRRPLPSSSARLPTGATGGGGRGRRPGVSQPPPLARGHSSKLPQEAAKQGTSRWPDGDTASLCPQVPSLDPGRWSPHGHHTYATWAGSEGHTGPLGTQVPKLTHPRKDSADPIVNGVHGISERHLGGGRGWGPPGTPEHRYPVPCPPPSLARAAAVTPERGQTCRLGDGEKVGFKAGRALNVGALEPLPPGGLGRVQDAPSPPAVGRYKLKFNFISQSAINPGRAHPASIAVNHGLPAQPPRPASPLVHSRQIDGGRCRPELQPRFHASLAPDGPTEPGAVPWLASLPWRPHGSPSHPPPREDTREHLGSEPWQTLNPQPPGKEGRWDPSDGEGN